MATSWAKPALRPLRRSSAGPRRNCPSPIGTPSAFEASAEYREALRDESAAYADLNAARRKAFQSLASDQRYQRLLALRQDLGEQIRDRRATKTIGQDELVALATVKMGYGTDLHSLEADALSADGGEVRAAQDRLVVAGAKVAAMRAKYDESLRSNPEILFARRNLEDSRIAMLTADAFRHAALVAGAEALDYAYYLHSRAAGQFPYAGDYGYGGYPNGGTVVRY